VAKIKFTTQKLHQGDYYSRAEVKLGCGHKISEASTGKTEKDAEKAAGKLLAYRTETHMKSCRRGK
jgi:hypothetical protein